MKLAYILIAALILTAACGGSDEVQSETQAEPELPEGVTDLQNATCPVMGEAVMDGQYVDWNGYRIHFCCAGCNMAFLEEPERFMAILAEDPSVQVDLSGFASVHDLEQETVCCGGETEGCSGE